MKHKTATAFNGFRSHIANIATLKGPKPRSELTVNILKCQRVIIKHGDLAFKKSFDKAT